jgi:ferric-dicitrate binding protein FerR (iron transport regulator)
MSDPNDILSFDRGKGNNKLSEDKLMAYLEGKLSPAEHHEVEQWLAEEGMESDALEGLRALQPTETKHSVNRLNHNLRKTLLHKKRKRRPLKTDHIAWIAILIILLLIVVGYLVIRRSM